MQNPSSHLLQICSRFVATGALLATATRTVIWWEWHTSPRPSSQGKRLQERATEGEGSPNLRACRLVSQGKRAASSLDARRLGTQVWFSSSGDLRFFLQICRRMWALSATVNRLWYGQDRSRIRQPLYSTDIRPDGSSLRRRRPSSTGRWIPPGDRSGARPNQRGIHPRDERGFVVLKFRFFSFFFSRVYRQVASWPG